MVETLLYWWQYWWTGRNNGKDIAALGGTGGNTAILVETLVDWWRQW